MEAEAPIVVSSAKALGEMLAAGPILNTAIGLSTPDLATLTMDIWPGRRLARCPIKFEPRPGKWDQL